MNRTVAILRMHGRDKFTWFILPWIICLPSFLINLIVGYAIQEPNGFYTGGVATIYIYLLVIGIITLHHTFPFSLGMSVRRTDFFLGTSVMSVIVSAITSLEMVLLSQIERHWTDGWGVGLHFFDLPFVNEGTVIAQFGTFLCLMLNLYFAGFLISCIYRRFGKYGMYTFFTLLILVVAITPLLISHYERWDEIWRWVVSHIHTMNDLAPWMLLLTALYALVSYALLRRSTAV